MSFANSRMLLTLGDGLVGVLDEGELGGDCEGDGEVGDNGEGDGEVGDVIEALVGVMRGEHGAPTRTAPTVGDNDEGVVIGDGSDEFVSFSFACSLSSGASTG